MAYWLVKTEPSTWSWEQQVHHGISQWDGVRNYQAAGNLRAMRCGDRVFFYHSVMEKCIRGVVEVVKESYPDPTDPQNRFVMVDFKTVVALKNPVSLDTIKKDPSLYQLPLVRQSRLSVMPIDEVSFRHICGLGGLSSLDLTK